MSKSKNLASARQDFLAYYLNELPQFSSPTDLESYLTTKNPQVILVSPFHQTELKRLWEQRHLTWSPLPWFPYVIFWPPEVLPSSTLPGFDTGWLYPLNPSSLLPVLALHPSPADAILDASAAPGGKTLALANYLYPQPPDLVANDISLPRFKRLRTTLKLFGYDTFTTLRSPIQALTHQLQPTFTKILLDAPCSSEKHVYNSKLHLKIWSPNRITTLCHLQQLLITDLLPLLLPGGLLVYSTCALSPAENEQVVDFILSRHPELRLAPLPRLPSPLPAPSSTLRVNHPGSGFDPMFVAIFQKSAT